MVLKKFSDLGRQSTFDVYFVSSCMDWHSCYFFQYSSFYFIVLFFRLHLEKQIQAKIHHREANRLVSLEIGCSR